MFSTESLENRQENHHLNFPTTLPRRRCNRKKHTKREQICYRAKKSLIGPDEQNKADVGLFRPRRKSGLRDSRRQTLGRCGPQACPTRVAPQTRIRVRSGPCYVRPAGAQATDRLDSRFLLVHCQGPRVGGHDPAGREADLRKNSPHARQHLP